MPAFIGDDDDDDDVSIQFEESVASVSEPKAKPTNLSYVDDFDLDISSSQPVSSRVNPKSVSSSKPLKGNAVDIDPSLLEDSFMPLSPRTFVNDISVMRLAPPPPAKQPIVVLDKRVTSQKKQTSLSGKTTPTQAAPPSPSISSSLASLKSKRQPSSSPTAREIATSVAIATSPPSLASANSLADTLPSARTSTKHTSPPLSSSHPLSQPVKLSSSTSSTPSYSSSTAVDIKLSSPHCLKPSDAPVAPTTSLRTLPPALNTSLASAISSRQASLADTLPSARGPTASSAASSLHTTTTAPLASIEEASDSSEVEHTHAAVPAAGKDKTKGRDKVGTAVGVESDYDADFDLELDTPTTLPPAQVSARGRPPTPSTTTSLPRGPVAPTNAASTHTKSNTATPTHASGSSVVTATPRAAQPRAPTPRASVTTHASSRGVQHSSSSSSSYSSSLTVPCRDPTACDLDLSSPRCLKPCSTPTTAPLMLSLPPAHSNTALAPAQTRVAAAPSAGTTTSTSKAQSQSTPTPAPLRPVATSVPSPSAHTATATPLATPKTSSAMPSYTRVPSAAASTHTQAAAVSTPISSRAPAPAPSASSRPAAASMRTPTSTSTSSSAPSRHRPRAVPTDISLSASLKPSSQPLATTAPLVPALPLAALVHLLPAQQTPHSTASSVVGHTHAPGGATQASTPSSLSSSARKQHSGIGRDGINGSGSGSSKDSNFAKPSSSRSRPSAMPSPSPAPTSSRPLSRQPSAAYVGAVASLSGRLSRPATPLSLSPSPSTSSLTRPRTHPVQQPHRVPEHARPSSSSSTPRPPQPTHATAQAAPLRVVDHRPSGLLQRRHGSRGVSVGKSASSTDSVDAAERLDVTQASVRERIKSAFVLLQQVHSTLLALARRIVKTYCSPQPATLSPDSQDALAMLSQSGSDAVPGFGPAAGMLQTGGAALRTVAKLLEAIDELVLEPVPEDELDPEDAESGGAMRYPSWVATEVDRVFAQLKNLHHLEADCRARRLSAHEAQARTQVFRVDTSQSRGVALASARPRRGTEGSDREQADEEMEGPATDACEHVPSLPPTLSSSTSSQTLSRAQSGSPQHTSTRPLNMTTPSRRTRITRVGNTDPGKNANSGNNPNSRGQIPWVPPGSAPRFHATTSASPGFSSPTQERKRASTATSATRGIALSPPHGMQAQAQGPYVQHQQQQQQQQYAPTGFGMTSMQPPMSATLTNASSMSSNAFLPQQSSLVLPATHSSNTANAALEEQLRWQQQQLQHAQQLLALQQQQILQQQQLIQTQMLNKPANAAPTDLQQLQTTLLTALLAKESLLPATPVPNAAAPLPTVPKSLLPSIMGTNMLAHPSATPTPMPDEDEGDLRPLPPSRPQQAVNPATVVAHTALGHVATVEDATDSPMHASHRGILLPHRPAASAASSPSIASPLSTSSSTASLPARPSASPDAADATSTGVSAPFNASEAPASTPPSSAVVSRAPSTASSTASASSAWTTPHSAAAEAIPRRADLDRRRAERKHLISEPETASTRGISLSPATPQLPPLVDHARVHADAVFLLFLAQIESEPKIVYSAFVECLLTPATPASLALAPSSIGILVVTTTRLHVLTKAVRATSHADAYICHASLPLLLLDKVVLASDSKHIVAFLANNAAALAAAAKSSNGDSTASSLAPLSAVTASFVNTHTAPTLAETLADARNNVHVAEVVVALPMRSELVYAVQATRRCADVENIPYEYKLKREMGIRK